jgi:methylated-DNA-[protein]-cysteine S-methyltransferase
VGSASISQAPLDSPIGRLWVAASEVGLVSIARGDTPDADAAGPRALDPDALAPMLDELRDYFEGRSRTFSMPLDLRAASTFDAAVWTAARQIPYGETVSYRELGAMAGYPGVARAVGNAMAHCPFAPVVPCHRVIHADGSIGGWGADTWVKQWLLDHEGGASIG